MERKLLFINRSKEEISEFLLAMPDGKFDIDTAQTGYDAGILLKQNTYGVVVLDMYLKGYDGEQIIKYMSLSHPDTVCIVYTYTLTRGQLIFLLDNRNIFRVFLSPANYQMEMLPAIEEAFMVYQMNLAHRDLEKEVEQQTVQREKGIEEKNRILDYQKRGHRQFLIFSERLIQETVRLAGKSLSSEEKKSLIHYEKKFLDAAGEILEKPCDSLKEVEKRLEEEFVLSEGCKKFAFTCKCREPDCSKASLGILYTSLWMLIRQYWDISKDCSVKIEISAREEERLTAVLSITLPAGIWERENQEMGMLGEKRQIVEAAVEEMVDFCDYQVVENENVYRMKVRNRPWNIL